MKNRECCLLTLQIGGREGKRGHSKSKVPSSTCKCAGGNTLNVPFPLAPTCNPGGNTVYTVSISHGSSTLRASVKLRSPPNHLLFNPCFHIESNLDLHTEKSYKSQHKNKPFPSRMGHLIFINIIWEH